MTRRSWTAVSLVAPAIAVAWLFGAASAQIPPQPKMPPQPQIPPGGVRPAPNLTPSGPRPNGASLPAGTVPFLETVLRLNVEGLPAGSHAELDLQSSCFTLKPRVSYAADAVGQDGRVQFARLGWATRSGACRVAGKVLSAAKGKQAFDMDFGTVPVAEPARYTVRNTWNFRNRLGFKFVTGTGTCEGTSIGIPNSFPVGIHKSGEDLSLVIHGGPIGTDCQFVSLALQLPPGMMLISTTWSKSSNGTCGNVGPLGGGATALFAGTTPDLNRGTAPIIINQVLESQAPWYSLVSADQPVVTRDNVILLHQNNTLVSFLLPMWTRLQCGVALGNEDSIRLTLSELVFAGPPGLNFP
jgi:hypothetical protein